MRVTNTASFSRAIAYAGDRNLAPGATSAELPITTMFHKTLLKDLENGLAAIRFSEADKKFIQKMLAYDAAPVKVRQRVVKAAPPPAKDVVVVGTPQGPAVPPAPTLEDISSPGVLAIPNNSGKPSLADLKRMNAAANNKLHDIKQFMGSRV